MPPDGRRTRRRSDRSAPAGVPVASGDRRGRGVAARPARRARGDLQSHSTYTDGQDSVADMAQAAADLGHSYLAVTDHSKTLPIAGGMDEEGFARQADEIEDVRHDPALRSRGFRLLHGIEMNVTPEGFGDMDPDFLRTLDIVLGTFHSKLRLTEDQTERYLAAIRNGGMDVFAHPRCRMFGRRLGLSCGLEPRVRGSRRPRRRARGRLPPRPSGPGRGPAPAGRRPRRVDLGRHRCAQPERAAAHRHRRRDDRARRDPHRPHPEPPAGRRARRADPRTTRCTSSRRLYTTSLVAWSALGSPRRASNDVRLRRRQRCHLPDRALPGHGRAVRRARGDRGVRSVRGRERAGHLAVRGVAGAGRPDTLRPPVHLRDEAADECARSVRRRAQVRSVYSPELVGGPVVFTDYEQVATNGELAARSGESPPAGSRSSVGVGVDAAARSAACCAATRSFSARAACSSASACRSCARPNPRMPPA